MEEKKKMYDFGGKATRKVVGCCKHGNEPFGLHKMLGNT
jgi:hypothetical protein